MKNSVRRMTEQRPMKTYTVWGFDKYVLNQFAIMSSIYANSPEQALSIAKAKGILCPMAQEETYS